MKLIQTSTLIGLILLVAYLTMAYLTWESKCNKEYNASRIRTGQWVYFCNTEDGLKPIPNKWKAW